MERPWEPDYTLSTESAGELLRERYAEFADARIERIGDGWDNSAFLVTGDGEPWVFRFPRRAVAAPLLEVENSILPLVAPRLPVPIPIPERFGGPTESYPWSFAGYRALRGETACRRELNDRERARLGPEIGRFLRALHDLPTAPLRGQGLPRDQIGRLDPALRLPQMEERLGAARRKGLLADPGSILRAASRIDPGRTARTDVLVHGDLYARHLLVGAEGQLSGVIDWGDIHAGDPAQDLGLVVGFLPRRARSAFTAEYGEVDESTWAWARFRALFLATTILVYGDDIGDESLVREGRAGLRLAME